MCLTVNGCDHLDKPSNAAAVGSNETLKEKYLSTKSYFEDHANSLEKIHHLNEDIRQRIIQESEKNHAKYDYYLKLQQNQFQKLVTKR